MMCNRVGGEVGVGQFLICSLLYQSFKKQNCMNCIDCQRYMAVIDT